jgi:hypothetical protein
MLDPSAAASVTVTTTRTRRVAAALVLCLGTATACQARADAPRSAQPSFELEVADRGADKTEHVVRFVVGFVNGEAKIEANDGPARYEVEASLVHDAPTYVRLVLNRSQAERGLEMKVRTALVFHGGDRVVVAQVGHSDGMTTTVTARVL